MNKKTIFILFFIYLNLLSCFSREIFKDGLVERTLSNVEVQKPEINLEYDYSDVDCVKIPIKINEKITTAKRNKSHEGQKLYFMVVRDVFYNNRRIIPRGTIVKAKIEIMTTRGFAGIPAEIFISDFEIPNIDNNKIMQPISKTGISMTAFIMPIKWALTPIPPLGMITNIIVGTNAVIRPRNILNIYYYPNYKVKG